MNKTDYTVLISSCDAYEDLWYPFFLLLKKNWPSIAEKPILLNTETKSFSFPGLNIKTLSLYEKSDDVTWSKRLADHLKYIKTPFVLFLLDDFFIESPVDETRLELCCKWMCEDRNIANFMLVPTLWENTLDDTYYGFEKRKRISPFRVSCQAGLWRTRKLLSLLRYHENPWEFETFASIRSRLYMDKFYVASESLPSIFTYDWYAGGAVHRGKWTLHAKKILEKNNIKIDHSLRGFDSLPVIHPKESILSPNEKNIIGRFKIRLRLIFKNWRSLI